MNLRVNNSKSTYVGCICRIFAIVYYLYLFLAISQRDISQYHSYNESEKYNIQTDIKSLFTERIKDKFPLANCKLLRRTFLAKDNLHDFVSNMRCIIDSFDVIRYKKEKVKIIDFGPMDESATKGTLFTYEELQDQIEVMPEFRFIGEEVGIQPKTSNHFCIPREINEFFKSNESSTLLDSIQRVSIECSIINCTAYYYNYNFILNVCYNHE